MHGGLIRAQTLRDCAARILYWLDARRPADALIRGERFDRLRAQLESIGLKPYQAWISGNVARGDVSKESDTEILILSDALPEDPQQRPDLVCDTRAVVPDIEPLAWLGTGRPPT